MFAGLAARIVAVGVKVAGSAAVLGRGRGGLPSVVVVDRRVRAVAGSGGAITTAERWRREVRVPASGALGTRGA